MKKASLNFCIALSVCLAVSSASGTGLVNGNFESPVLPGIGLTFSTPPAGFNWTVASGDIEVFTASYWQPASGNQSVDMNGSTTGSIYQDFMFSSSQTWAISFALSANPDQGTRGDGNGTGIKNMRVDFGTPGSMTSLGIYGVDSTPRSINNMQYVTFTTPQILVSDSVLYRLQFTSLVAGNGGAVLDNVQLQVVPEPGTLALLCSGLTGLFVLRRHKCGKA